MDPRVAFGSPVLIGTAVPTSVLADRFKAGDTFTDLAKDYGAQSEAIEEAIRCEFDRRPPIRRENPFTLLRPCLRIIRHSQYSQ